MIRVTVELLPRGNEEDKRTLGIAHIANDGSGSISRGNYRSIFYHKGLVWAQPSVSGFERQKRNVWYLLYESLRQAVGGR